MKKNVILYKGSLKFLNKYRGVAQLVARVVWDHEVAGSIPVASTTTLKELLDHSNSFVYKRFTFFDFIDCLVIIFVLSIYKFDKYVLF